MGSTLSLSRVGGAPRDLKTEASAAPGRDPHGRSAGRRPRRESNEPENELEVDTFEHVAGEPQDS